MMRACDPADFDAILSIINDAAMAYKGIIPAACWHEPYMSAAALRGDIAAGVKFYGYEDDGKLLGVMGIQYLSDVTLIRHAYVLTSAQGRGIGGDLLTMLLNKTTAPVLIGTWRDTPWSIGFYRKYGFAVLDAPQATALLTRYWKASPEHFAASVVLADGKYRSAHS